MARWVEEAKEARPVARLLVVEDDEDLLFLIEQFFEAVSGVDLRLARSVAQALEILEAGFVPAITLADFALGGGRNSIELCRIVEERFPECLLFLMSGHISRESGDLPPDVVVDEFFEKPFSFHELMDHINQALEGRGRRSLGLTRFPAPLRSQIETLRHLLEQDPRDASVRCLLAFCLYTGGHYREAVLQYDLAHEQGFSTFHSRYYAGHACARLRSYEKAVEHWERSIDLAPSTRIAVKVRKRIVQARRLLEIEASVHDDRIDEDGVSAGEPESG